MCAEAISSGRYNIGVLTNCYKIQLATSHSIPFLVRGAGHSYTTTIGDMQDGLDVDLSQLKSLELDAEAGTVTIGPGVTMAEVFDPLYEAGFEIRKFLSIHHHSL